MKDKLINWWRRYRKPTVTTAIIALAVLALIRVGYLIDAAGFNGYHTVTIATSHSGTSSVTVTRTEVEVPAKSFWDWLQLLFIPAVLTLGAIWYTARQNHDLQITLDNQRETMLQTYLDKMSELLLHENLRQSKRGDDVRNIAHARTLTVLPKLDPNRKRSIVLFLVESVLISRDEWIIDMSFADLRGVDLSRVNLQGANLYHANFERANLRRADLSETDLWGANMAGADLTEANLKDVTGITVEKLKKQAKSLKGATMPDGSTHP